MSGTVTVASKLDTKFLMQSDPDGNGNIAYSYDIVGTRDPGAIDGFGLTYDVDQVFLNDWLTANPEMAEFVTTATPEQIATHSDPANTHGYELGFEPPVAPIETPPPVNVDVPYVWQEAQRMRCTMGNWDNYPTHYSYQWVQDGTLNIGADNDTLPMLASNDGHTITCVVTASNASGATTAPPSNGVLYTAPTVATAALLLSADLTDPDMTSIVTFFNNNQGNRLGFDIVVDGLTLKLSHIFGAVVGGSDICNGINSVLGAYMTVTMPATAAPWQFNFTSNTTGVTSTITYASAPTTLAARGSVAGLMASVGVRDIGTQARPTQDVSILMKLRQSNGAITVQGLDASGTQS